MHPPRPNAPSRLRPPLDFQRRQESRSVAAPHNHPPSRPQLRQHPVVGAIRESPVPRERDPHPTTTSPRITTRSPPRASFLRRQESRGARRGASPPPTHLLLPVVGALPKSVRPEPVEGPPARVIPAKAVIQRGAARGRLRPPSHPPLPTARALPKSVRPEPVEARPEGTRRGPSATSSSRVTPAPSCAPPRS